MTKGHDQSIVIKEKKGGTIQVHFTLAFANEKILRLKMDDEKTLNLTL